MKIIGKAKQMNMTGRMQKKLRWGIAGCGQFSENTFLPSLMLLKRSKLISIYSGSLERAKSLSSKFFSVNSFNNYDQFLSSDINAVYIGSVNADHYEQVIKAAKAGKHILCDKPLALNSKQAEEMVNICKEKNVFLTINYTNRFHPLTVKAKELLDNQVLGKLISITIHYNIDLPPDDNFRFKKELSGGGALRDLGTHIIDLLRYFGGEINSISGNLANVIYKCEVEDFANGIVKFEKSGFGYFNVSYNSPKAFNRIEILGYKGALSIENMLGKKNVTAKLVIDLKGEGKKAFRKRANKQVRLLKAVQKSFLKNETPQVTGEDGLINLKLIEALEENVS